MASQRSAVKAARELGVQLKLEVGMYSLHAQLYAPAEMRFNFNLSREAHVTASDLKELWANMEIVLEYGLCESWEVR